MERELSTGRNLFSGFYFLGIHLFKLVTWGIYLISRRNKAGFKSGTFFLVPRDHFLLYSEVEYKWENNGKHRSHQIGFNPFVLFPRFSFRLTKGNKRSVPFPEKIWHNSRSDERDKRSVTLDHQSLGPRTFPERHSLTEVDRRIKTKPNLLEINSFVPSCSFTGYNKT